MQPSSIAKRHVTRWRHVTDKPRYVPWFSELMAVLSLRNVSLVFPKLLLYRLAEQVEAG